MCHYQQARLLRHKSLDIHTSCRPASVDPADQQRPSPDILERREAQMRPEDGHRFETRNCKRPQRRPDDDGRQCWPARSVGRGAALSTQRQCVLRGRTTTRNPTGGRRKVKADRLIHHTDFGVFFRQNVQSGIQKRATAGDGHGALTSRGRCTQCPCYFVARCKPTFKGKFPVSICIPSKRCAVISV